MIEYELGSCSLGCVLVASSDNGICAIALGDEPGPLVEWLKQTYPHVQKGQQNRVLLSRLQQVLNFAEWPDADLKLELDIQGTEFQKRVWRALLRVPPGQTRTYTQIAEEIGSPSAVRAVAGACAANLLALAIPCHRIIRQDGEISGYRWGRERKKILLQKEARL